MIRKSVTNLFFLLCLLSNLGAGAAEQKPTKELKQLDFAKMLVSAFHWEKGLPEKPVDSDYLSILGGRRSFYYEAEDFYSVKTDNASVKSYELYGPFSGKGWVSGVAEPTMVHFNVFIPVEGDYTLTVGSKGDGQVWSAGGKKFKISTGNKLREEVVGKAHLKPGEQEVAVELPPEGGVDYFRLDAPQLTAIEPLDGWRMDAPLTAGAIAEIAAALLQWEPGMPEDSEAKPLTIEAAEAASVPSDAVKTTTAYLGAFQSKEWVRAGRSGARLVVPVIVRTSAPYQIKVRFLGDPFSIEVDGKKFEMPGKPFLESIDFGVTRLKVGAHSLILRLPPNGGVDVITLQKRKSSPAEYMKLAGIDGSSDRIVTRAEAERFLTSFNERFTERR